MNTAGVMGVTDSSHQSAFVFRPDGSIQSILGLEGPGTLSLPRGIAVDNRGRVFVSDAFAHRVQAYSADGQFLGSLGEEGNLDGQFSYPERVALDNQGTIYVGDRANRRIQEWKY